MNKKKQPYTREGKSPRFTEKGGGKKGKGRKKKGRKKSTQLKGKPPSSSASKGKCLIFRPEKAEKKKKEEKFERGAHDLGKAISKKAGRSHTRQEEGSHPSKERV